MATVNRRAVHNLYGPTEAAVDVSWYPAFARNWQRCAAAVCRLVIRCGIGPAHSRCDDASGAAGCGGRFYLTGIQLAQGYLGRPDLTAAALLPILLPQVNGCTVPAMCPLAG